jgi:hypothetical protein
MNFGVTPQNQHYGYYTVNNIPFSSKNEAAIFATKHNTTYEWHFNDELHKTYNWTKEPELSLDQLYDKRAFELRQKYDYLIISYSGGADSHNVLESFLRQNLFVDEIIVNINTKLNKLITNNFHVTDSWNYGAEYKLQIYPRLEEIKNRSPRTKITVVDVSDVALETMRKADDASWVIGKKEPLNISGITRFNYLYFSDLRKNFDLNKKIGIIVGVEKPWTYISKNKIFVVFADRPTNLIPVHQHFTEYTNTYTEFFYWDPSAIDIVCKQVHVIKKWLIAHPENLALWTPKTVDEFYSTIRSKQKILSEIIYSSTWNSTWFQVEKDSNFWYSQIDAWWHKLYRDTREYAIWKEGINYIAENAKPFVYYDNGFADSLKVIGKSYYVSDLPDNIFTTSDDDTHITI